MAQYPYAQPIAGLDQIISHLRKTPLKTLDAGILKKLAIAPSNESYIMNTVRALGIVDTEGKTVDKVMEVFLKPDDDFETGFASLVEAAYKGLFNLHDEDAWKQEKKTLISFFRQEDKSSELIGSRQAETFIRLAGISGKRELVASTRSANATRQPRVKMQSQEAADTKSAPTSVTLPSNSTKEDALALSVKIEVNLPPTSDQAVYDAIFKSIRKQLIDRE